MGQSKGTIAFRHTPGITERVDELARTINDWQHTVTKGLAFANSLAAKPMSSAAIKSLWIEVIERLDGKIPAEPQKGGKPLTGWELRSKERAISGLAHMAQVFDREAQQFGATAWVAANAATNWIEHERSQYAVRTKDAGVRKYAAADGATADDVELVFDILAKA
jgi:predicted transcriptional regulator